MALDTAVISSKYVTITALDYTGSALSVAFSTLVGDVILPRERGVQHTNVMVNGATGLSLYATPTHGQVTPPAWSFQFLCVDPSDNAEVTAPVAFVRALSADSVAGTAYTSHNLTSRLTGFGKLQAKFVVTEINEVGVSHISTLESIVTSIVDGVVDGVKAITVNLELVAAPVLS